MSALIREDWENLRNQYKAAFTGLSDDMFKSLMDEVFGDVPKKRGDLDKVDAMLITLARSEPGIQPSPSRL
jgi:hypothetical protein